MEKKEKNQFLLDFINNKSLYPIIDYNILTRKSDPKIL